MEFRNHQNWMKHQASQMSGSPLTAIVFGLLFLVILIPLLALGLLSLLVFLVTLPFRLAWLNYKLSKARAAGGPGPTETGMSGRASGPTPDHDTPSAPGPIIDVEVTRSNDL